MKLLFFLTISLIWFPGFAADKPLVYETETMRVSLDGKGMLESLYDRAGQKDYLYQGQSAPLLSIRCNGEYESPSSMKTEGDQLVLCFEKNQVEARVKVVNRKSYLTFELVRITPLKKVELVVWGPYPTTISETIGETVGVVRNQDFAIGIQALNIKTLGGYPSDESDIEPSIDIAESSLVNSDEPWRAGRTYRGQTAKPESYGSVIQAYCRDRSRERVITNWGHDYYVAPPFKDGGVVGSKIALFGCPTGKVLEVIGGIELREGLPHPMLDGVWSKISPEATSSYLIIDFDENTINEALALTRKVGFKYLYHGDPFETWGHFNLKRECFPRNWESMKADVTKAEKEGIYLGVHMLSNFITTNDPYVTPVPDKRLAKVGSSVLAGNIDSKDTEIRIVSPVYFNQMKNNTLHAVVIGNEIIRYREVSGTAPWTLQSCTRGAFGTRACDHAAGDTIAKLMDHGYKTFLTNSELTEEVAGRLADFFNYTGVRQTSFDGLEGNWSTGMGEYGCQLFVKTWYDRLIPALKNNVIDDASKPNHYNWHINTRYNWGEPWYAGFRESQTRQRLKNQDFFRRNYIPSMLGWFKMTDETSIEDLEWLLARAAGFDAGFAFCVNLESAKRNGEGDAIFNKIRQWETARISGAFTVNQKKRMENINNEFHLEEGSTAAEWMLYPYRISRYIYNQKIRQPGEPVPESYEFVNPYVAQPLQFIIRLLPGENGSVSPVNTLRIGINNNDEIEIPVEMEQSQYLKSDGSGRLLLYDRNWNLIREIKEDARSFLLDQGKNLISFEAVFSSEASSKVKIEMKAIGPGEKIEGSLK